MTKPRPNDPTADPAAGRDPYSRCPECGSGDWKKLWQAIECEECDYFVKTPDPEPFDDPGYATRIERYVREREGGES